MNPSKPLPRRGPAQLAIAAIFALLAIGFLFRLVQYGFKWVRHVAEAGQNFKALTLWALVYVIVCAGIAAFAWFFPQDDQTEA